MQKQERLESGLAPDAHPSEMKEAFSQIIHTKLAKYGEAGDDDRQEYEAAVRLMAEGRITRDDERELLMCFYGRKHLNFAELTHTHTMALAECVQKRESLTETLNVLEGALTLLEALKCGQSSGIDYLDTYRPDAATIH